jgi:hypothetical protein
MQEFIVPFIISLVISALFALSSRYSAGKHENGDQTLSYAFPIKFFGGGLFAAGSVGSILFFSKFVKTHPEDMLPLLLCCVIFTLLPLGLLVEFLFVKSQVSDLRNVL